MNPRLSPKLKTLDTVSHCNHENVLPHALRAWDRFYWYTVYALIVTLAVSLPLPGSDDGKQTKGIGAFVEDVEPGPAALILGIIGLITAIGNGVSWIAAEIQRSQQRVRARIQTEEAARLEAEARAQQEEANRLAAEEQKQEEEANRLAAERLQLEEDRHQIQQENQELQDRVVAVGEGEQEIREFVEFVRDWFGPLSWLWQR
jgi:hypothetical protein